MILKELRKIYKKENKMSFYKFIKGINTFEEFYDKVIPIENTTQKGTYFEWLCKYYLLYNKDVFNIKEVFHQSEFDKLDISIRDNCYPLHSGKDKGIDLLAIMNDGGILFVQSKCYNKDVTLQTSDLKTFPMIEKYLTGNNKAILLTTAGSITKEYFINPHYNKFMLKGWKDFSKLDKTFFDFIRSTINKKRIVHQALSPLPHQITALNESITYLDKNTRGKLIMPCGTGKTMVSYFIYKHYNPGRFLFLAPSLNLLKQSVEVYLNQNKANKIKSKYMIVCSDKTVDKKEDDITVDEMKKSYNNVSTDLNEIKEFFKRNSRNKIMVFATYQSGDIVRKVFRKRKLDMAFFDEAHRTVSDSHFGMLVKDKNLKAGKKIFMTATEKVYNSDLNDVIAMNHEEYYGDYLHSLSIRQAINDGLIVDYRISVLDCVSDKLKERILNQEQIEEKNNPDIFGNLHIFASAYILIKSISENITKFKKIITYHSSIEKAKMFIKFVNYWKNKYLISEKMYIDIIEGSMNAKLRKNKIEQFEKVDIAIIANSRCLTEGQDIKCVDSVMFVDPKWSKIDIIQSFGRALRNFPGKEYANIIIPTFISEDEIMNKKYERVVQLGKALKELEENITDEYIDKKGNKLSRIETIKCKINSSSGIMYNKISSSELEENIKAKILVDINRGLGINKIDFYKSLNLNIKVSQ
jgi:predicted helicase